MEIRLKYGSSYVTLPSNNITELTQEANLFLGESFYIGSTVCRSFKLGVDKRSLSALPDDGVLIYEGSTKYADLVIDNIDDEDVRSYKFTLTDRMVRLNEQDSSWFTSGRTIQQLLSDICTQYGIAGVDTIAAYGNLAITWYDNWTARDFVSWVAELLGGYAYISANNYLKFDTYSNTPVQTIPVENCDSFKLGEQITIDRVVYDMPGKTVKYPVDYSGTGCTLYLNTDNALFTDSGGLSIEDQVEYIYNVINGFSFYNITVGKCPINRDVRAGQCIGFSLDGTVYNTIAQVNWNYNSMWLGGYELKLDSPVQAETQIVGAAKKTQTIIQKIDREVGEISSTVSSVEESTATITNMLYDTNAPSLAKVYGPNDRYFSSVNNADYIECTYISLTDAPRPTINYGVNINVIQTIPSGRVRAIAWPNLTLTAGTTYTVSCYARVSTASAGGNIGVYFCYGANPYADAGYGETYYATSTDWTRFSWTFTADSTYFNASGKTLIYVGMFALSGTTAGGIDICNYFLQTGEPSGIDTKGSAIYQLPSDLAVLNGNVDANTEQIQTVESHVNTVQQTAESNTRTITSVQENIGQNYYTKTETTAKITESANGITEQYTTAITNGINAEEQRVTTMIRRSGQGIAIGLEGNQIEGRFDNDSLDFVDTQNNDNRLAWVDANEGLGGSALAVGDPSNIGNRWRIFTRQSGTHLTFTRHS